ncbi:MAG: hypothetical protein M1834_009188 [Cirrosporium novae-zelandiae]|nr:MAG: hypothetical protein M1834_009188 [Cirrosporium novae-zelandiae]
MDSPQRTRDCHVFPVAGVKRSAPTPSLLPAFEPTYSSPTLPRPTKRLARSPSVRGTETHKYPTPIPTSSTDIISSPPSALQGSRRYTGLQRPQSSVSERAPLADVPSVTLEDNGEWLLFGRSSGSSHYQLSANRLISRVHVRAKFQPATSSLDVNRILIECLGWNGVRIHCRGQAWELGKGDSFSSDKEDQDIMLDVQDARVVLQWPTKRSVESPSRRSDSTWDDENESSPRRGVGILQRRSSLGSPLSRRHRLQSPISPSPAVQSMVLPSSPPMQNTVQVYEDEHSSEEPVDDYIDPTATMSTEIVSQPLGWNREPSPLGEEFDDQDEENDPIIHSFGPFGGNVLPRMAPFTTRSPFQRTYKGIKKEDTPSPQPRILARPKEEPSVSRSRSLIRPKEESPSRQRSSSSESIRDVDSHPIIHHAVNQLAFSRLNSTPLSIIMDHLPKDLKGRSPSVKGNQNLTLSGLQRLLRAAACLGEVTRQGKDAAGKPLESEFYYIPENDPDEQRRQTVVGGLGKTGLRSCRKQHKVL